MTKKYTFLLLGAAVTLAGVVPAFAQSALTEQSIRDLYEKGIQMRDSSPEEYVKYLQENMTEDVRVALDVEMSVEGMKGPKTKEVLDKKGIIERSKGGFNPNNVYKQEIISIDISADGQSATIKDETDATIFAEFAGPSGAINLEMDQSVLCDIKMVNDGNGKPLLSDTACNIDTEIVGDQSAIQMMKAQIQQQP